MNLDGNMVSGGSRGHGNEKFFVHKISKNSKFVGVQKRIFLIIAFVINFFRIFPVSSALFSLIISGSSIVRRMITMAIGTSSPTAPMAIMLASMTTCGGLEKKQENSLQFNY